MFSLQGNESYSSYELYLSLRLALIELKSTLLRLGKLDKRTVIP